MKNDGATIAASPRSQHLLKAVVFMICPPENMVSAIQTGRASGNAGRALAVIVFELRHPLAH